MEVIDRSVALLGAVLLPARVALPVRAHPVSGASRLGVASLETEHKTNPLGIDVRRSCLGWKMGLLDPLGWTAA